ncbi:hypothetical protein TRFO_11105 [Tritrichomonas foetus]|uniref:Uncharacterized protein n=1 Tax=Tritrichomonas foetus TaxID=1144522 RepID=A0A1J4JA24_9EUKA|nr:hypothetical protein TRFO_11105 [Tritrichomonas foetus]|eukprot:OHS94483.1 hypothetical protein TRFO_11105 [Tritrichomonas foetus]
MNRLLTSEAFSQSAMQSMTGTVPDTLLFDEKSLLRLDMKQQNREAYVKARLNGLPIDELEQRNSFTQVTTSSSKLTLDLKSRVELLRRQIQEVREEKKKILAEGVRQVQSYMEQLKREQAAHAKEMKKLRDDDTEVSAYFIKEVEKLKQQYRQQKKPLDEIITQVKSTIANSGVAEGQSISSIQVTEIKSSDSSEAIEKPANVQ